MCTAKIRLRLEPLRSVFYGNNSKHFANRLNFCQIEFVLFQNVKPLLLIKRNHSQSVRKILFLSFISNGHADFSFFQFIVVGL